MQARESGYNCKYQQTLPTFACRSCSRFQNQLQENITKYINQICGKITNYKHTPNIVLNTAEIIRLKCTWNGGHKIRCFLVLPRMIYFGWTLGPPTESNAASSDFTILVEAFFSGKPLANRYFCTRSN
jgi:hypothetical protein